MLSLGWSDDRHRRNPHQPASLDVLDFSAPDENAQLAEGMRPLATYIFLCLKHARESNRDDESETFLRDEAVHAFYEHIQFLDDMYDGSVEFDVSAENKVGSGRFDLLLWIQLKDA